MELQVADKHTIDYVKNMLFNFRIGGMSVVENDLESFTEYVNVSISTLPYDFFDGSAVVLNGEIHILGGNKGYTNHYKWNGSSWTSVSTLPYYFCGGSAVVLNGEIHILGAYGQAAQHYKWNGSSWTSVSTLPYYFGYSPAVVLNGKIHILGGYSSSSTYTNHYKWNGSSWTNVSTLPYDFYNGSSVVYNNEIHILGSNSASDGYTKHYKWNGSSWSNGSTWTSVSTLPYGLYNGRAVVCNNEIHILGGSNYNTNHYYWNGVSWIQMAALPYPFDAGATAIFNNEIHILGSYPTSYRKAHYRLNTDYKKVSLYLLQNQKVYTNQDMSNVTALTNCTKETSNLKVIENGLTEFKVYTTDSRLVLTIKG